MKKNAMLKIAAILMVAVLLTTCAISSTFAKYVSTADDKDTARVAKWGVTTTVTANGAFLNQYKNGTSSAIAADGKDILAPGTNNANAVVITIAGTPEVSTSISAHDGKAKDGEALTYNYITLTNEDWSYMVKKTDGSEEPKNYCPLVITINGDDYQEDTAEELMDTVNGKIKELINIGAKGANEPLTTTLTIGWSWAFESGNDEADTALGDKAITTEINIDFNFKVSVEQTGPAVVETVAPSN